MKPPPTHICRRCGATWTLGGLSCRECGSSDSPIPLDARADLRNVAARYKLADVAMQRAAEERKRAIVRAREQGMSWRDIAEPLGVSDTYARMVCDGVRGPRGKGRM